MVEFRHLHCLRDELVQPLRLFVDYDHHLRSGFVAQVGVGAKTRDRHRDRSERRAKLVGDGVQDGVAQTFALATRFAATERLYGAGALNGDRDEASDGVERLSRHSGSSDRECPDRAHAETDGDEGNVALARGVVLHLRCDA